MDADADSASIGAGELTAYQSIVTRAKKGDKVFIKGGFSAVSAFGTQFTGVMECHVTTTCSTANMDSITGWVRTRPWFSRKRALSKH